MNSAQSMPQNPPMLGFKESVVRCLRKYATFRGRATRAEYWWFSLFNTLIGMAVYAAFQHWLGTEAADEAVGIVQLALFLPALAVAVRRLHDINFNGWWMLLGLTVVGIIPLCIFFCLPGKTEDNRFGSCDNSTKRGIETEKRTGNGSTRTMGIFLCQYCLAGLCLAASLFMAGIASGVAQSSSIASTQESPEAAFESSPQTSSSGQDVKQNLQETFGGLFSIMGETIGGMTKGMQDGARDIQAQLDSSDGTRLITNSKDLAKLTETRVLRAEQREDRSWRITLAVKNPQEFPVRLTGLTNKQQVLLLDQENFIYEQSPVGERILTVPERAAQKLTLFFPELDGSSPKTIRLYGMDFAVPHTIEPCNVSP